MRHMMRHYVSLYHGIVIAITDDYHSPIQLGLAYKAYYLAKSIVYIYELYDTSVTFGHLVMSMSTLLQRSYMDSTPACLCQEYVKGTLPYQMQIRDIREPYPGVSVSVSYPYMLSYSM